MSTTTWQPPNPPQAGALGALGRLARWSNGHRRLVIGGWIALLLVAMAASHKAGTHFVNSNSLSGTDSQRATSLLKQAFPSQAGDDDRVVLHTKDGQVTDPGIQSQVEPVLRQISALPHVTGVQSPFTADSHAVSRDGRTAFATVTFDKAASDLPQSAIKRVIHTAEKARSHSLQVELGGEAIHQTERPTLGAATAIGILAAVVILLLTFGSLAAMGLPILTALLGLGSALGLIGLGTHVLDTPDFATQLAAMIGLGVGVDYALFIVTRFRELVRGGADVQTATERAMDTAGRAVLFAGLTVILAMLALLVLGIKIFYGVALASSASVLLTMFAALSFMPTLLQRFGSRIAAGRRHPSHRESLWPRWAAVVAARPWPALVLGLTVMIVLAAPVFSIRLGQSDASNDPTSLTTRRAYDQLASAFGKGFNGPLVVAARLPATGTSSAVAQITSNLKDTQDVAAVAPPALARDGRTAVFRVIPRSGPEEQATTDLVHRLREQRIPVLETATGARLYVGGATATSVDFAHRLGSKVPLFVAVVILLAGLLLAAVFRSVVIPLQAALMNLLSIGASLGVVVAVFQHGWLGGLFGVKKGPIEAFIPIIVFAIVFGLSMDYEVFLISRVHEEFKRTGRAREAVVRGVGSTGRVITAAAAIMVCVFVSFMLGDQRILRLFGLSLATAVFLDAFVVRSLLLPSVLSILGRRTWSMPAWMERRLPRVAIEAPETLGAPRLGLEET
jgi:RND superfamily putative drug exporter